VAETHAEVDLEYQALVLRSRALVGWVLTLVATLTVVGALIPMRYLGQGWSEDDVFECQASAFVAEAAATSDAAGEAAVAECLRHRRGKRWGPWGAFGDANDASEYNAADDSSCAPQTMGGRFGPDGNLNLRRSAARGFWPVGGGLGGNLPK
jgi:hypothetical protein